VLINSYGPGNLISRRGESKVILIAGEEAFTAIDFAHQKWTPDGASPEFNHALSLTILPNYSAQDSATINQD